MSKFLISAFADEASQNLDGQIAALKRNGLSYLEARALDGKNIAEHSRAEISEIKKKLDGSNIHISSMGSPIGKISVTDDFGAHFEQFRRVVEAAQIFGTKNIRMFSFYIPKGEKPEDYRGEVLERLAALLDYALSQGMLCCHENESGIYGDIAARNLELLKHFDGKMRAVFDSANYILCGETISEIFDGLEPYTEYLHVKDAVSKDGAIVPAGHGDGDYANIIKKLSRREGKIFLTVEPHLTIFKGLESLQRDGLRHRFTFDSPDEAFDTAVTSLKNILTEGGYAFE